MPLYRRFEEKTPSRLTNTGYQGTTLVINVMSATVCFSQQSSYDIRDPQTSSIGLSKAMPSVTELVLCVVHVDRQRSVWLTITNGHHKPSTSQDVKLLVGSALRTRGALIS